MTQPAHCVAVIGGAVAGAEMAGRLAEAGTEVVVFEQNPRPYGKIEDGLPRWHHALRNKEYTTIGKHLSLPNVHYVPNTKIGCDIGFRELVDDWGFSGVVLANGAWRDRRLPLEGADAYLGKGLIYQNAFIVWFNHAQESDYRGESFDVQDDAIVVGGGLASIDVVKVLMLETTRARLALRGIEVTMLELEVKGIPKILKAHGLEWDDLDLSGCTLYYRRRAEDMPLVEIPEGADEKRAEKVRSGRRKLLEKAMQKYRFKLEPLCMPDGLLVEDGQLVGLRFRKTEADGSRVTPTDETFERRGSCVISSIGSVPLPIEGIPMKGELFDFVDWDLGRLADFPTVFATGNVATGKGNIVASRKHAKSVAITLIEAYLGVSDDPDAREQLTEQVRKRSSNPVDPISNQLRGCPPMAAETLESIRSRVRERQQAVDYDGDYAAWIQKVTPPDFE